MRFYFQDAGQKVATKCVNVTSFLSTKDVIDILIEKFRPDMRMLSVPEYGLYEIHENGDERKLESEERPLLVQLEWNKDDREGRFLLRRMDEKTRDLASTNEEPSLKRKLSKKERKKHEKLVKKQQKEQDKANAAVNKLKDKNGIATKLYNELPETSFTRSISNPEAVMKRRRAQKLEKRLQEFSLEGGQEAGGTLRIFGETINKDVSYKTLLLSTKDTASYVVKQILEKYGKEDEDPNNYCLVQLIVPQSATTNGGDNSSVHDLNASSTLRESFLDDNDIPLLINQNHDRSKGILTFHIRQRPADFQKHRKKKPPRSQVQGNPLHPLVVQQLNQRLQINNNHEQYSNQNSPQASSQTSGSVHDTINLPPPFETTQNVPTMYHSNNGGMLQYPQQLPQNQHSMSATLIAPPRLNSNQHMNNIPSTNGTMTRLNYSQPNMIPNQVIQNGHFAPQSQTQYNVQGANDQILPALIQVKEEVEDIFLNHVITHINPTNLVQRLAPTYVLYMVSRYRASTLFHPELQAPSRAELFVPFTRKIASIIRNTIEIHQDDPTFLAFWLANSSELSHFYKNDKHLSHFTLEAQEILDTSIRASFKYLLNCKQAELNEVLYMFFDERDDTEIRHADLRSELSSVAPLIAVLQQTMDTVKKNRVNPEFAVQLYNYLFHHISKWLFDRLVGVYDCHPISINGRHINFAAYCNRFWGDKLYRRLSAIMAWTEGHGLEKSAVVHLARATQATLFLSHRYSYRPAFFELKEACDKCGCLNQVQVRALLHRYQPEQPNMSSLIEQYLSTMSPLQDLDASALEEPELIVPFLMPTREFSSDNTRYIPKGLLEFVCYLSRIRVGNQELCIFTLQPTSSGFWTVYFKNHQPDSPEIIVIQLRKKNNSMGLSIIATRGMNQERQGIYIKNVVKNGAAAMDGRLQAGDQLLEVDGHSLLDKSQEQAAELMQRTGPLVTLRVAKQAALHHDLSDIINTPTMIPSQHAPNFIHQATLPPPIIENDHQSLPAHSIIPERHFQPPPPLTQSSISYEDSLVVNHSHGNPTSPVKSPKKVSWVDNQPHQSLHTLIPPSPSLVSSPPTQIPSTPPEVPSPPSQTDEQQWPENGCSSNGQSKSNTESLTLEDIDEVLSSKTHNNWLEDSAGVIGTQEVYNDPRQRIVEQRERPETTIDIHKEKLSVQEKIRMFSIQNKES